MPIITLKFSLPNEKEEYELASKGPTLRFAVDDFDNWLRGIIKYNDQISEVEHNVYQQVREKLHEFINHHND